MLNVKLLQWVGKRKAVILKIRLTASTLNGSYQQLSWLWTVTVLFKEVRSGVWTPQPTLSFFNKNSKWRVVIALSKSNLKSYSQLQVWRKEIFLLNFQQQWEENEKKGREKKTPQKTWSGQRVKKKKRGTSWICCCQRTYIVTITLSGTCTYSNTANISTLK